MFEDEDGLDFDAGKTWRDGKISQAIRSHDKLRIGIEWLCRLEVSRYRFVLILKSLRTRWKMEYVLRCLAGLCMQNSMFFAPTSSGPGTHQVSCLYLPSFSIAAKYFSASSLSIFPSLMKTSTSASRTASGILPLLPHR